MRPRTKLADDVAAELRRLIKAEMSPGMKLPAEAELAAQLGVSRNTVREALTSLWGDGLLTRRWGVGTFVRSADEPIAQTLTEVASVPEMMRRMGYDLSLADIEIERVPCPARAASALSVKPDDVVWYIARSFAVDGQRAMALLDWLPLEINGQAIDPSALKDVNADLLTMLRDVARCRIVRMEAQLAAIGADSTAEKLLRVRRGAPILFLTQVSISDAGAEVIFSRNYYNTKIMNLRLVRNTVL